MSARIGQVEHFITAPGGCMWVRVKQALGSVPREAGSWMLVSQAAILNTIGGGQLEFLAIDHARRLLKGDDVPHVLDIPLGPDIGQCCGGRVVLGFDVLDATGERHLLASLKEQQAAQPHIFVFGAGHVGRALAETLAPLPYNVAVVDTRPDLLDGIDSRVAGHVSPVPETFVRSAPVGSAFVAVTHDHALDFMVTREALLRRDASYVGMIGSGTKRAQFKRWFLEERGNLACFEGLVCPIGAGAAADKRPEIIAVLTSAELICNMGQQHCLELSPVPAFASIGGDA